MKTIRLAQPGEMFERHAPDSQWITDPDQNRVRKAVVKRRIPKGAIKTPEGHFREHTDKIGQRSLIPLKASDQRNIAGYKAVKYYQMRTGNPDVKKSQLGTDKSLGTEIKNIRSHMAGELNAKRGAIHAIKRQMGANIAPLPADKWQKIKDPNTKPAGVTIPEKGKVVDMNPKPQIKPSHVSEVQDRLRAKTDSMISQRSMRGRQLQKALENATTKGVIREHSIRSTEPMKKDVIRSKVHNALAPMSKDVIPSASEKVSAYGHLSNYTGKSVDRLARIRQKLDASRAWQTKDGGVDPTKAPGYRKKIEQKLLAGDALFGKKAAQIPKAAAIKAPASYPALRKLGIGTAITVGAVGAAGVLASRKKEKQVQMSARTTNLIQLARGDVYERATREFVNSSTRPKMAIRTLAARGRTTKQMGTVQRMMGAEHQANFIEKARAAGNKNTLSQERTHAAVDLVKARAIKQTRNKVVGELADRDRQIETLTQHKENFKKRVERLQQTAITPEDAFTNGRTAGYKAGKEDAEFTFVNNAKTTKADFDRRVKGEADYHEGRAKETIRKAKAGMNKKLVTAGVLTGGAGLTTGVVANRKKEQPMQFSEKDKRREVIRGAANMGVSAGVTGAATGLVLGLAKAQGKNKIGLGQKFIRSAKSGGKIGIGAGIAGLASAGVGTAILGTPKKGEGAAYTKRGAVGGSIIGAIGGGAVGALALKNKGIRKFIKKHSKEWAPLQPLLKAGAGKRVAIGSSVGAVAGAAQMADEGQQVDTINSTKKRKLIKFAAKDKDDPYHDIATGAVEGGVGVLATDPLIQKIETGQWKNPLTQGAKSLGKKALIGAGVGAIATGAIGALLKKARANQDQQLQSAGSVIRFAFGNKIRAEAARVKKGAEELYRTQKHYPGVRSELNRRWEKHAEMLKSADAAERSDKRLIAGAAGVTAIGGAALIASRKKKSEPINFAVRQSVSSDRYKKQNENQDLNRRDANIARSVVAGSALGAVLKKAGGTTKQRAIIGAASGAASVLGIRAMTQKDQFNDRSHEAKVAEGVPWKAAAVGTGIIAASGLRKKIGNIGSKIKFAARSKLIQFDLVNDSLDQYSSRRRRPTEVVQAEKTWQHVRRGSRVVSELVDRATGKPRVDERGREKRSEFSKPWVKNLIATGIIAGTFVAGKKARKFVSEEGAREVAQHGTGGAFSKLNESLRGGNATKAVTKMPGVSHVIKATKAVGKFAGDVKREAAEATRQGADRLASKINEAAKEHHNTPKPAPAVTKVNKDGSFTHMPEGSDAAKGADSKRRVESHKKINKIARGELSAILDRVIQLAEYVDDWDIRDPRGNSARVFAPGSQRRSRRGKHWHEKKDNRDLLQIAGTGAAFVAGTLLSKGKRRIMPAAVKAETRTAQDSVDEFVNRARRSA